MAHDKVVEKITGQMSSEGLVESMRNLADELERRMGKREVADWRNAKPGDTTTLPVGPGASIPYTVGGFYHCPEPTLRDWDTPIADRVVFSCPACHVPVSRSERHQHEQWHYALDLLRQRVEHLWSAYQEGQPKS
jgi:hypothetical protein